MSKKLVYLRLLFTAASVAALAIAPGINAQENRAGAATKKDTAVRRNIIFVLTDDQRHDALGFINSGLRTPNMDLLASRGVHFKNAFVTTSLCSPSRATILTGQYMHDHGVVDNNNPAKPGTVFFSQYLQRAGYQTAFIGKWHMGGHRDDPQPGFDHWVSFAGQGEYYPKLDKNGKPNMLNVNGEHVPQKGYITDELTDYALDWLNRRKSKKPFFMYLSHKAVHSDFSPAERHKKQYEGLEIPVPASQADTEKNYRGKPMWVKNQRNSWHGVDFPYHSSLDVQAYKRQYYQALSAVDDSLGRLLAWLRERGLEQDTVILFMGDNGFLFGEHGLIDKRNAYEESMRVPLLAYGPGILASGAVVENIAANIDIAPTILNIAGVAAPEHFAGQSLYPLARGKRLPGWREHLLYEYYWEFNFPHTPTTFALRTSRYKLIQYHGIWDTEELYDLQEDPGELNNLIDSPEHLAVKVALRRQLYRELANSRGEHVIPYTEKYNQGAVFREADRSKAAEFPQKWLRKNNAPDRRIHNIPDLKLLEQQQKKAERQEGGRQ